MKVLRLGNSQDAPGRVPAPYAPEVLLKQGLEAELGEPVEVVTRRAWPNERMPGLLRGWLEEESPDVVFMSVTGYWFMYQSVPLKLKRRLGRLGLLLGDTGLKMADTPWLAHNRVFRAGRKLATRLIGGETNFTADEIIERMTECIKEVVRNEGVVLVVEGPGGRARHGDHSRRSAEAMEERRKYVTRRVQEICAQYRVTFHSFDAPLWQTGEAPKAGRDGLHYGVEGNLQDSEVRIRAIAGAVRAARGATEG